MDGMLVGIGLAFLRTRGHSHPKAPDQGVQSGVYVRAAARALPVARIINDVNEGGARMFRISPRAYDGHVGRYSSELARGLIQLAGVRLSDLVVDVGCGTGLLTAELASVVGAANVTAVDPSPPFVDACRDRVPGADVRLGTAEQLPLDAASVDRSLAQLVINFLPEPLAGLRELRRVTRSGGTAAACVWDYAGEMRLLRAFWDAATAVDSGAAALDEGITMANCTPVTLRALWEAGGLHDVDVAELRPSVSYAGFDELWAPFLSGVGPSGAYAVSLDAARQAALRDAFFGLLGSPRGRFVLTARAWAVVGRC
jgi:SAM-dependent methyltransferase